MTKKNEIDAHHRKLKPVAEGSDLGTNLSKPVLEDGEKGTKTPKVVAKKPTPKTARSAKKGN